MATKAEALQVVRIGTSSPRPKKALFTSIRRWMQNGQLGAASSVEMSRYTGGRI